jgi:hypothetical protein
VRLRLNGDNVKKFIKLLGYLAVGLVLLVLAAVMYGQYKHYLWKPPTSLHGISVGMSRSDVVFALGDNGNCEEGWCLYDDNNLIVHLDDDKVFYVTADVGWMNGSKVGAPFGDIEQMKERFGDEDILSVSKDFKTRAYTYLKYDISFFFRINKLQSISIGNERWRTVYGVRGQYFVAGKQVCPSPDCPFGEDDKLKPEYEDKSYDDFL